MKNLISIKSQKMTNNQTIITAVGDPHFRTDNIQEVEMFIEAMIKLCNEVKPNLIVILGDLLHTHERLHTMALNKALFFIDQMRKISPTIVLVGNHDLVSNQEFLTTNHWMNSMKEWDNVTIVDTTIQKTINDHLFTFVPYVYPGRFEEALNYTQNWKESTAIFAHQEFYGCKMGAIVSSEGDKWSLNLPNVVSGHIHSNQTIGNIYYCGSSLQHAFGESDRNIIPVFTWKNNSNKYELKEVDLGLPRKKIIYKDISEIENLNIEQKDDKIKLSISGKQEEFKAFKKTKKYKDLVKDGIKVVFKNKKINFEKENENDDNENNNNDNDEKNKDKIEVSENDFQDILKQLIFNEKDKNLVELYEMVVNDKKILSSDIMFIN